MEDNFGSTASSDALDFPCELHENAATQKKRLEMKTAVRIKPEPGMLCEVYRSSFKVEILLASFKATVLLQTPTFSIFNAVFELTVSSPSA